MQSGVKFQCTDNLDRFGCILVIKATKLFEIDNVRICIYVFVFRSLCVQSLCFSNHLELHGAIVFHALVEKHLLFGCEKK